MRYLEFAKDFQTSSPFTKLISMNGQKLKFMFAVPFCEAFFAGGEGKPVYQWTESTNVDAAGERTIGKELEASGLVELKDATITLIIGEEKVVIDETLFNQANAGNLGRVKEAKFVKAMMALDKLLQKITVKGATDGKSFKGLEALATENSRKYDVKLDMTQPITEATAVEAQTWFSDATSDMYGVTHIIGNPVALRKLATIERVYNRGNSSFIDNGVEYDRFNSAQLLEVDPVVADLKASDDGTYYKCYVLYMNEYDGCRYPVITTESILEGVSGRAIKFTDPALLKDKSAVKEGKVAMQFGFVADNALCYKEIYVKVANTL